MEQKNKVELGVKRRRKDKRKKWEAEENVTVIRGGKGR